MGVYTIAGGKGGVGKSTTTASLGVTLRDAGLDVALVDADLAMANLADILGVEGDRTIHHVLAGEASVEEVLVAADDGLHVVPGGQSLELFEAADPAGLRDVVAPLARSMDVVLVDTGAGLGHETLVATGLADGVVLATTPHEAALADVAKTAEFVDHADASVLGAVLTRTTERTDLAEAAEALDVPLLGTVPDDPSVDTGPVTSGAAGDAYGRLAAALLASGGDAHAGAVDAPATVPRSPVPEAAADDRPAGSAADAETEAEGGSIGGILSLGD